MNFPVLDVETVIVGAGFSGIGLGIQLLRQGKKSFVVLERAAEIGGTWRDNVYPGVACDIPSHLYSYSFLPKPDWSHFFAPGAEIHEYLQECVQAEGLSPYLRLRTAAKTMSWDEGSHRWLVRTSRAIYRCEVLVMAVGRLSEPRIPAIPGLSTFNGPAFHSSRWEQQADFAGKRIGVVGTGASAVQLVPQLAEAAHSLVLFQRSAAHVIPRNDRPYSAVEKRTFGRLPTAAARLRSQLFWRAEAGFIARAGVNNFVDSLQAKAREHLETQIEDPALRAKLTPDYTIGCKRVLLSDSFYPTLTRPEVTLEQSALERVNGNSAIAASGAKYEVDVLIFATGFYSTRLPFAEQVFGLKGRRLADEWQHGMSAYASTAVHGFPNMFVINGPNASLGHNSAVFMIEAQVEYILQALQYRTTSGQRTLHVSAEAQQSYTDELDRLSASTVWMKGGCESWYLDSPSHRLTLLWPGFGFEFRDRLCKFEPHNYQAPSTKNDAADSF